MRPNVPLGKSNCCLVVRTNASRYPVITYQANILAESGTEVLVLETSQTDRPEPGAFDSMVQRKVVGAAPEFGSRLGNPVVRWQQSNQFASNVRRRIEIHKPKVIIAYDIDSCAAIAPLLGKDGMLSIFFFLELPDRRRSMTWFRRRKLETAIRAARQADLVVHPDPYRAALFLADSGLQSEPLVVPNCPMKTPHLGPSPLRAKVEHEYGSQSQIVLYVGVIGAGRGLLSVLRSMPLWPANAVLVCRGMIKQSFAHTLLQEAQTLGVAERLMFQSVKAIQAEAIWVTSGADVGLVLYEPISLNKRYVAYASQKLFEYMAAGVAIVSNRGPGFDELVDLLGCGLCVDPCSPDEIGEAIHRLLTDDGLRERCGQTGRRLHLERFNYEQQFGPVYEYILDRVLCT